MVPAKKAAGTATVRTLEPFAEFPTEVLPEPIRGYVQEGAKAIGCDASYLALPALAAVSAIVGNKRSVRLKRGWEEPSVIWTAIIGDSGSLKSPACQKSVGYLFRLQKRLLGKYREEIATYQREVAEYERARRDRADSDDPVEKPKKPVLERVVCSDTTIEKLAEILEDNPAGILIFRDELSGWLGSFERYKGRQIGTDLPAWLEMFRAGTVIVDRKTAERKTIFIPRAAVSITGGIQPGILAHILNGDFLEAGLAARLLMAMPPKLTKRWTELEIPPDLEHAYERLLDRLILLDFAIDADDHLAPYVLRLSAQAKAEWVAFYDSWAREQAAVEGDIAAAYSKLEGYTARFALLHHVTVCTWLEVDDRREIGIESMKAAIILCRWFAGETRRIYATFSESTEERERRRLEEFIQTQGGQITVRALQRANSRKYPTATAAEEALNDLVEKERARWTDKVTSKRGGRPTRVLELLPTADETSSQGDEDPVPHSLPEDVTADNTKANHYLSGEKVGFVGIVESERNGEECNGSSARGGESPHSCVGQEEDVSEPIVEAKEPTFLVVRDRDALSTVRAALENSPVVGLDIETTGLDPRTCRVRLLSLAVNTIDGGIYTYVIDCFSVDPTPLWCCLSEKAVVAHNAAFDLSFLMPLGFTPLRIMDTMLQSQVLYAGQQPGHKLQDCVKRELGQNIDKVARNSDWTGELSPEQLAYAARDAEVLLPLTQSLQVKIDEAKLTQAAEIEQRCLPALVWLARSGVNFNQDTWSQLAQEAERDAQRLSEELDAAAPPTLQRGMFGGERNWDSPEQVKQALLAAGYPVENTDDDTLARANHPFAELVREYRDARKRCTTYGRDWLKHVRQDGRVYAHWQQIGATSGRMACGSPNLQNLPRGAYRRCFQAPAGRTLIKADYSQIELRIAAKISGDANMLAAYQAGHDLHTLTARRVLGMETVNKEQRQLAKALNFGLLYGMGSKGFQGYAKAKYALDLSEDQANAYRMAFFKAYPGLAAWHRRVKQGHAAETRTLAGRRCLLHKEAYDTFRLNAPVQGTGADGLKLALALLWERREQAPGAFVVLVVHDEIVVESDESQADLTSKWLKGAMLDGMAPLIDPVPVEVELKHASSWGD
jgi:DNA polymerase-1